MALVFIVAAGVPVLGLFMVPLPALYYRLKLGRNLALAATAVAAILWGVVLKATGADLFVFIEQLVLGMVLGECLARGLSAEKAVGISACAAVAAGTAILFYYAQNAGVGLMDFISAHVTASLNLYRDIYKNMGIPQESLRTLSAALDDARYIVIRTFPGLWAATAFFGAWACLLMVRPWLRAGQLMLPALESLNRWVAPEALIWGVIACGILMLVPHTSVRFVGLNGLFVVLSAYFFQGVAIMSHQFGKKGVPGILRWFLYSLIVLQPYVLFFVIGLGIFDMWLDMRRLKQPKETNGVS
jgi:uncharacterized protein YybS (DUF2232 family)